MAETGKRGRHRNPKEVQERGQPKLAMELVATSGLERGTRRIGVSLSLPPATLERAAALSGVARAANDVKFQAAGWPFDPLALGFTPWVQYRTGPNFSRQRRWVVEAKIVDGDAQSTWQITRRDAANEFVVRLFYSAPPVKLTRRWDCTIKGESDAAIVFKHLGVGKIYAPTLEKTNVIQGNE